MSRLRLRLVEERPELRCPWCGEWWLVSAEMWAPNRWDRCRACEAERMRLYRAIKRHDPEYAAANRERRARYKRWIGRLDPSLLAAYERELAAKQRERVRQRRSRTASDAA